MGEGSMLFGAADLIRRAAAYYPSKTGLVFGERRITYGELDRRASMLSNGLRSLGLSKGGHVAMLLLNCPAFLETYFAVAKAGGVVVPLNTRLTTDDITYMLNHSDSEFLVYGSQFAKLVESIKPQLTKVRAFITDAEPLPPGAIDYESLLANSSDIDPDVEVRLDDISGIYYTGGTTGVPKGVIKINLNVISCSSTVALLNSLTPDDIVLGLPPWFHVAAWDAAVMPAIVNASTVVTAEKFDPIGALDLIQREKVTYVLLIPTMSRMIVDHPDIVRYDRSSVRAFMSGGATVPDGLKRAIVEHFPNARVAENFGSTEAGIMTFLGARDSLRKSLCCGIPNYNVRVRIVDDEGNDVPKGGTGEIVVRGPQVMAGYYKDEKTTAQAMSGGWFHTGDLGMIDDEGYMYIRDRKKDMIKTGGENVFSAEVERVILQHPAVKEAAVVGLPDEVWGERVVAVVQLLQPTSLGERDLIDYCRTRLAHFKCPKQVIYTAEPLPKTSVGKLMKPELRSQLLQMLSNAGR